MAKLWLIIFFFIGNILIFSQDNKRYPPSIDVNTVTWKPYNQPTKEPSSYLKYFTEDCVNVIRIGDQKAFGETGQQVGHNYATNAVWNSDGSLLKLNVKPAKILYDSNYTVAYTRNLPSWSCWSYTNPYIMYGTQNGNQFVSYNVTNDKRTVLHTFHNYTKLSIGKGEGRQDRSDTLICLVAEDQNDVGHLIVYNIKTNTVIATKNIGDSSDLDWASVSPLGNYVIAAWHKNGTGKKEGYRIFNSNLTNEKHLYTETQHSDIGIDVNGDEVLVAIGNKTVWKTNHYIAMIRLKDGLLKPLFYDEPTKPRGIWGGWVSCQNTKRDGWAYISEDRASDDVMANEIFAIKLDYSNNNIVQRFGKHHSDKHNSKNAYYHGARACVNPDGTKICFDSNYGDSVLKTWEHAPAWIMEYPQE
ncbi:hypothetical protein GCM10022271_13210 [Corallibacter vietnamensis]|uniref:Uncharacterized protein n=1 Tax=Corallibacter vietnamensis TaxID=904130 RepID=A0ABP7H399_9FLAO